MNTDQHLHWTYRQLRLLAGSTLIVVPVAIVLVAWFSDHIILPTLSHYYFAKADPGVERTLFTGFLILVGGIMLAYRGFDGKDNWIHNAAGVLAIAVALFPKGCSGSDTHCVPTPLSILHMPSAVLLFVFAAWAVWYGGGEDLAKRLNDDEKNLLRRWRVAALVGMISGVLAYVPFILLGKHFLPHTGVLIVELTGFFGFAFHWLGLTHVIHNANQRKAGTENTKSKAAKSAGGQPPSAADDVDQPIP